MSTKKTFPSFFTTKDRIVTNLTPFAYRDKIYWSLNVGDDQNLTELPETAPHLAPYEDNEGGLIDCSELEETYEITQNKSGKFETIFKVPSALQSAIVGKKGTTLHSLQDRTQTKIRVPGINDEGPVRITGNSERAVASARTQVALLTLKRREKLSASHFLSLRLHSEEIHTNFNSFKSQILSGPAIRGIESSVFQDVNKLHLTVTVLTLLDQAEAEEVCRIIQEVPNTLKGSVLRMTGVEIMNDDPSEVDVLYGKVFCDGLQQHCDDLVNCLVKKDLIRRQYEQVKLHVTLMNSRFRRQTDEHERNVRETFDASTILDRFKSYDFGCCRLKDVEISLRFSTGPDGYYEAI